ncbi:Sodium/potassium-transporting ATPase subunit alpha [Phytophthora nicotianae]|uniref:Sodium/potassium-transporting ATPase subunit alpha n=1 Tax=Phytophthora nicotianae TaxID=4792 RepID=A0A0W8DG80_PHYNI|nr:Sodium/potassium-transporting ATPase subunit alpha [Phytophthora nicotianae]
MSGVESFGDGDVRERLLPARPRQTSQDYDGEDAFTHEELLHSIGSFSAVVWPVAVTMLLARCPRAHQALLQSIHSATDLMERGEKIELLVTRTNKLQQDAMKYEKSAKKLKNAFWWMNVKYWIYVTLALAVLALIVTFMICGTDLSSCAARIGSQAEDGIDKVTAKASGATADAMDKASTGIAGGS